MQDGHLQLKISYFSYFNFFTIAMLIDLHFLFLKQCRLYDNPTGFEVLECDHSEIMRTLKDDRLLRKYNWKDVRLNFHDHII